MDKKWDISAEQILEVSNISPNVYVCKTRISCALDTWSLVQATYELLKFAKINGKYSYFCFMSGQDYPINPISFIVEQLNQLYPKSLIDCTPYDETNWVASGFKRIRFIKMHNAVEKIVNTKMYQHVCMIPVYILEFGVTLVFGSPIKRLRRSGCKLFGGSAWWILPWQIVDDVIDQIDKNTDIVKAFRLKTTPEETFFQTIAMRSTLADMVDLNPIDAVSQNCMTYAYFQDVDKKPTGHPYVFTIHELAKIKALSSSFFFARKFDIEVDKEIINQIDSELLHYK